MASFDPYHQWLDIPPEEQPPTYYRLLGIPRFESDKNVIAAAAERQTIQLRTFQDGPHSKMAEQLLKRVITARVTLLSPQTKAKYDQWLNDQEYPKQDSSSNDDPLGDPTEPDPLDHSSIIRTSTTTQQATGLTWKHPWSIATAIATITILSAIVFMLMRPRSIQQQPAAMTTGNDTTDASKPAQTASQPSQPTGNTSTDTPRSISASQQDSFEKTWVSIFDALGEKNFPLADEQLQEIEKLAGTTEELLEKYERLSLLAQYTRRFQSLWSDTVSNLDSGDELTVGSNELVIVVEVTDTHLTIKSGKVYTYSLTELPPILELAIIQTRFNLKRAGPLMAAGAHYATRPQAKPEYLDKAREFWSHAAKLDATTADMVAILSDNSNRPRLTSTVVDSTGSSKNKPIPSQEESDSYLALLKEVYADGIEAATQPADRERLAAQIFTLASRPVESDAELYVILQYSYTLARDSRSELLTSKVRTRMAQEFAIDVLSHRLSECEFWEALIPQQLAIAEQSAAYDKLATVLETIISDAEAAERYDIAVPACEQAFRMDPSSTWRTRKEQLELGSTRYLGYNKATGLLKNNPDDPAANLATGKYLGFTRTDWAKAMPYLARGSDGQLRQLAKAEQQDPADSAGMKALGDLWLEHAENDADPEDQLICYRRAATWYQQSLDNEESPIRKLVVEKKLDNLVRSKLTVPEEEVTTTGQSPTTPEKADVAINKITLDFSQRIARYRVELPGALNTDNLVLRVTHLAGFPDGTTVITPDGIVPTEKELLIGFDNDPLKVRFRLKLSVFNRIAIIQVRSTFRRLETAKTDVVLTADELKKTLVANNYSLNKDASELAAWGKEMPSLERDLKYARSQSTLNLARAKYNRASSRVFYLNNAVRRTRLRVQRLLAIQNALSQIHQTATIHFDIVPAPTGN